MTPDTDDVSFMFPYEQGHHGCICSRCLNQIKRQEIALRMLRTGGVLAFEEYRYCEACQQQAGFTPQRSADAVLLRLTAEMREHSRYRATKADIVRFVRSIKANRAGMAVAKAQREAKVSAPCPWWEDLGSLNILAVICGKQRS